MKGPGPLIHLDGRHTDPSVGGNGLHGLAERIVLDQAVAPVERIGGLHMVPERMTLGDAEPVSGLGAVEAVGADRLADRVKAALAGVVRVGGDPIDRDHLVILRDRRRRLRHPDGHRDRLAVRPRVEVAQPVLHAVSRRFRSSV